MVTIYDVAREAGVSRSTVSRVINGKREVNEETRQRVEKAMKKLGYRPNTLARSLALQKTNTLGIVSIGLTEPFFSAFIDGIHDSVDKKGYGAIFCKNDPENEANIDYLSILYGKVDGIIFIGEKAVSRRDLVELVDKGFPVVLIESSFNIPGVTSINVDNYQGAYSAVRYLIQLGHRKIAHIMGRRDYFESRDRLEGYKQALKDYRIDVEEDLIKEGNFIYSDAYECSKELLEKDFTAVFCASDVMAAAFMRAAIEKGKEIPKDISVIGFDDVENCGLFTRDMPLITTIRQPRYEMANYAVEALIDNISKGVICEDKVFRTKLIVRDSTAFNEL